MKSCEILDKCIWCDSLAVFWYEVRDRFLTTGILDLVCKKCEMKFDLAEYRRGIGEMVTKGCKIKDKCDWCGEYSWIWAVCYSPISSDSTSLSEEKLCEKCAKLAEEERDDE